MAEVGKRIRQARAGCVVDEFSVSLFTQNDTNGSISFQNMDRSPLEPLLKSNNAPSFNLLGCNGV